MTDPSSNSGRAALSARLPNLYASAPALLALPLQVVAIIYINETKDIQGHETPFCRKPDSDSERLSNDACKYYLRGACDATNY